MNTWTRPSGIPAATQRSQNTETMSVSGVPARPAWVTHADNSLRRVSFMARFVRWSLHLSRHHRQAAWWLDRSRYEAGRVHRNQGDFATSGCVTFLKLVIVLMSVLPIGDIPSCTTHVCPWG